MKPEAFNFPLFLILLGICLGIIIQDTWSILPPSVCILLSLGSILFLWACFYLLEKFQKTAIFLCGLSIGALCYNVHNPVSRKDHYVQLLIPDKEYTFSGVVEDIKGRQLVVSLAEVEGEKCSGKISLFLKDSLNPTACGKSILCHSKLSPIPASGDIYHFDYKKYMQYQGIFWRGYPSYYKLSDYPYFSITLWAKQLQTKLSIALDKEPFSKDSRAVLKALVLGIRTDSHLEIYQQYIDAGAVHILAISGLHIGIITFFLTSLLTLFVPKRYKLIRIGILLCCLSFYSLLTGFSASVLRAVLMFGCYSIAYLMESRRARYDSLLLSAFILLLCKPTFLFEVGFQLSYMAVLSIEFFLPYFNKYVYFENKLLNFFTNIIKVSIAAQIGVFPLSLYYFHQFAGLFLLTNILILPLLGGILAIGIIVVLLSYKGWVTSGLIYCYDTILHLMNKIIAWVASVEHMVIRDVYFDRIFLWLCYLCIIGGAIYLKIRKITFLYLSLFSLLLMQSYLFYLKYESIHTEQLIVFQQYKKTIIASQVGKQATFYLSDTLEIPTKLLQNFHTQQQLQEIHYESIRNIIPFKNDFLTIIDAPLYLDRSFPTDYILLRNSPKIHLEKFLSTIQPKMLIADGSNRPFIVEKWKLTCQKLHIPFHYTKEDGNLSL